MALSHISGVRISGMCSVVPETRIDNQSLAAVVGQQELDKIIGSTGIKHRRILSANQTSLSLANIACKTMLTDMNIDVSQIGLIICVTQTPDFPFPGNAVQLQHALMLTKGTPAFDINLGCSGFVYGLWKTAALLNTLETQKALLVVGDSTSTQYSSDNKLVNTLFGDASSAILLEKDKHTTPMIFDLGSDGSGAPYLIQPNNGAKKPNLKPEMYMDGMQVFAFTLREVPKSIKACLNAAKLSKDEIDFVVMHQANTMMIKHLADKLNFTPEQAIIGISEFGNTSSASIPLAMTDKLRDQLLNGNNTMLLSGFGVGWSWATVLVKQSKLEYCRVLDLLPAS